MIAVLLVVSVAFPARLDTPVAVRAAARTAHQVSDRLAAERLDVAPDEILEMRSACAEAARGSLPAEARAEALACAVELGELAGPFLADESPIVRAAAVALLAPFPDEPTRTRLLAAVDDADPDVAAAALGALCVDDATRTLREVALPRVRALVADKGVDPGHAAQISRCIRRR